MKTKHIVAIILLVCIGGGVVVYNHRSKPMPAFPNTKHAKNQPNAKQATQSNIVATSAENTPRTDQNADLFSLFIDRNRPLSERVPPDITVRLPEIRSDADFAAALRVLGDVQDDDAARNEAANLLRRSSCPGLTDALLNVLNNPAEKARFRAFAVQHLWQQTAKAAPDETERITVALHALLSDRHAAVRREALLALVRLRDPKGQETAIAWLHSPEPAAAAVRDLAIRCVQELDLREQIPVIRKYARDSNEVVRITALVALSQWLDEESRPAFEEAARSPAVRLQRAGNAALKRLAGSPPTP